MSIKIVFAARLLILIQLKFQICNLLKPKSKNTDILSLKDKNALCSLLKIEEDRGVCKQNLIMAYAIKIMSFVVSSIPFRHLIIYLQQCAIPILKEQIPSDVRK